jgi:hypothetical protein
MGFYDLHGIAGFGDNRGETAIDADIIIVPGPIRVPPARQVRRAMRPKSSRRSSRAEV